MGEIRKRKIGNFIVVMLLILSSGTSSYGYVLNTSTKKVHNDNCKEVLKIAPENHRDSDTAFVNGYTDCQKCRGKGGTTNPNNPSHFSTSPKPIIANPSKQNTKPALQFPAEIYTTSTELKKEVWRPITQAVPEVQQEKKLLNWGWQEIERIIDGDTIRLKNGTTVRFTGVDTPETVKPNTPVQPFGKDASFFTEKVIVRAGNRVFLEKDGDTVDRYGRQLAMVYIDVPPLNGEGNQKRFLLNQVLIQGGLGKAQTQYNYSQKMKNIFIESENYAKEKKVRIWSNPL